ncbi:MAG TPA: hypothetical protein PK014_01750 [Thermoanaerobaculia bacterium]|nr:hypothetical protein [Thermoanaerobaculia bacterium]HUM28583.1 hypothetical protein [Thermoanaerobaculia bacterium]HXK66809.1 hypothetical protein [Thermoanaerobaculia bacterium]
MRHLILSFLFLAAALQASVPWEKGETYLQSGQLDRAFEVFLSSAHLESDPILQSEAYLRAAYVRFLQNDMEASRSLIRLCIMVDPSREPGAWATTEGFFALYHELKSRPPVELESNLLMAETKLHDGQVNACRNDLQSLIDAGYGFQEVYRLLGDTYVQMEKFAEAESIYQKAKSAESILARNRAEDPQYRLFRAAEAYRGGDAIKALELLPETDDSPGLVTFRLSLLAQLKKYDKLMAYLASHPQFRQDHRDFGFLYGTILTRMNLFEEAEAAFTELVKQDRFWVEPRLALARLYWSRNNLDLASSYYSQVILLEPTNPSYLKEFGIFLLLRGDVDAAKERLSAAYQFASGSEGSAEIIPWYALALRESGEPARAISILEGYVMNHPSDSWSKELLGLAFLEAGKTEQCIRVLEPSAKEMGQRILARCLMERGRFSEAQEAMDRNTLTDPQTAQDRSVIAMVNGWKEKGLEHLLQTPGIDAMVQDIADRTLKAIQAMQP